MKSASHLRGLAGRLGLNQAPGRASRNEPSRDAHTRTSEKAQGMVEVQTVMHCPPERVFSMLTDYDKLPEYIFGLHEARVTAEEERSQNVQFTMKLPFPVGIVKWTNLIETSERDDEFLIKWRLVEGQLKENRGHLHMTRHGENGNMTRASYCVVVESGGRIPKSGQHLATKWLLPRIVHRLKKTAERG